MILGEAKRILVHIRFPIQSYVFFGFIFGLVVAQISFSFRIIFAFISWLLLTSGITVFNSYYDKDKNSVAGLKKPPKVSESMFYGSIGMKLIGFIMAFFISALFLFFYILGVVFSFLYSHRYFRFKSNGFVAFLFNFIIGFSTFIVASSLDKLILSLPIFFGAFASGLFLSSIYLMMQIHQVREDKERGDISIAVKYGKNISLGLGFLFMLIAGILITFVFYMIKLNFIFVVLSVLFFIFILASILWWIKTKKYKDFEIMDKITSYSSYIGNFVLLIIYIIYNF